jgi:hypothetical protein
MTESLERFYADPRRRRSRERDLGLCWRGSDGRTYRAALVLDTSELYTFEHVDPHQGGGAVDVVGRVQPERVDTVLRGWRKVCGEPGSYEWLRRRVGRARRPS